MTEEQDNQTIGSFIQDFLTRNLWSILIVFVTMILFYANTTAQLSQVKADVSEAKQEAASLRTLIERIIVLEEHDKTIVDDIGEIKTEIKEVKQLVIRQGN